MRIPMLDNILDQPTSHRGCWRFTRADPRPLALCADLIRKATGRILFTGMGGSLFALPPAVVALTEQGYRVETIESAELLHYGSAGLRAGDVAVLISRSGGSIEPVLLAEKMRQAGVKVIAVTNVPGPAWRSLPTSLCP